MASFHAICLYCGKSVYFERNKEDEYVCPYCGRHTTYSELLAGGNIINVEQARADYATAHEYFSAGDFAMAEKFFDKVRKIDKNNFFAEYFYRLSDIRRKRQEGKLCGAEFVMDMLAESVAKMKLTSQPVNVKRGFLLHAFAETESLLGALYDTIGALYCKPEDADTARREYIVMGRDCRRLTMLDRDAAMLGDGEVSAHVVSVCEVVMRALQRAVSFISSGDALSMPSAEICDEAKALYGVFIHFVRTIRPGYTVGGCEAVYKDNAAYNAAAKTAVSEFAKSEKADARRFLTTRGEAFGNMMYRCRTAFDYTYNTIFVCPGGKTGRREEAALIGDAILFSEQIMMPRASVGPDGLVELTANDYSVLTEFSRKLSALVSELETLDKPLLDSSLERLYSSVCEAVRYRFNEEEPRLRREIDEARMQKNRKYFHYRNLMFGIVCASAAALTRIVPYTGHRLGDRIRLLKIGKQAADVLLYMFGYRLEDIEKVPKFSSLTEIYGCINTDLKLLS